MILDDHVIVRKGMQAFLEEVVGIDVVGDAASGQEAIWLAESLRPDVILMDLITPEMDGVDAIRQIHLLNQVVYVVVVTNFIIEEKLFSTLMGDAHNYLLKDSLPDELVEKIQQTYRCVSNLHSKIARRLLCDAIGYTANGIAPATFPNTPKASPALQTIKWTRLQLMLSPPQETEINKH